MKCKAILSALILGGLLHYPVHGSAPSPEELSRWQVHEQNLKDSLARAEPWRQALKKNLAGESDTAVEFLFLTTYKHHIVDSAETRPPNLEAEAKTFSRTWKAVKVDCVKSGLHPDELAEAIYRFTNSDWAPMSLTKGPGLDQVSTPVAYLRWAKATLAAGRKALKTGTLPATVWRNLAASYQVREPKDLTKVDPAVAPPRF